MLQRTMQQNKNVSSEKNQSRETMDMTEDDACIYVTTTIAKTSKNILEGSHKEGEKGNDEVKIILELELRVRQMERELKEKDAKLRQIATVEQEKLRCLKRGFLESSRPLMLEREQRRQNLREEAHERKRV